MWCFRRRSLDQKLVILFTLTAAFALAFAVLTFMANEVSTARRTAEREGRTMAHLVASHATAALAFHDTRAGHEVLSSLLTDERVVAACLIERDGVVRAAWSRGGAGRACSVLRSSETVQTAGGHLLVSHPVVLDREVLGVVRLSLDLSSMYLGLARFGVIALLVLVAGTLIAMAIAGRLQEIISAPVLALAGECHLPAEPPGDDELATVIGGFRGMVEQMHRQDAELQTQRVQLRALESELAQQKTAAREMHKAKLAAEEASRAKSRFLARMSQELRAPLDSIIGSSERLLDAVPASRDELTGIRDAGLHLRTLVDDVLDLSRIEAGRMELHLEEVPVGELITSIAPAVEPLARRHGNQFAVESGVPGDSTSVCVDPIKFRQSLLNLLSNACTHTENGSITLAVDRSHTAGRDWIRWNVRDTGAGIDPGDIPRLFQSYPQSGAAAKPNDGGNGLGLALSQRFCQLMGGHITAASEPGHGSTFTIHMPASGSTKL